MCPEDLRQLRRAALPGRHDAISCVESLQGVERTARLAQVVAGHVRVALRRSQAAVAQQGLDRAYVHARFEELRGKAVTQGVKADRLADARLPFGLGEGALDHRRIQRPLATMAGKQPHPRPSTASSKPAASATAPGSTSRCGPSSPCPAPRAGSSVGCRCRSASDAGLRSAAVPLRRRSPSPHARAVQAPRPAAAPLHQESASPAPAVAPADSAAPAATLDAGLR